MSEAGDVPRGRRPGRHELRTAWTNSVGPSSEIEAGPSRFNQFLRWASMSGSIRVSSAASAQSALPDWGRNTRKIPVSAHSERYSPSGSSCPRGRGPIRVNPGAGERSISIRRPVPAFGRRGSRRGVRSWRAARRRGRRRSATRSPPCRARAGSCRWR